MNSAKAKRILLEVHRRHIDKPKWFDDEFIQQNDFIMSPARLKAVQCTRRAGKSYGCGLYAMKEAYETPGVSIVIIGLTRDSVKRIFYKDILKVIDKKYNLKCRFNGSDLTTTLPNGSVIYLLGVDDSPDDMDKLLGQKNKLVIVDESAFFRQNFKKLIYEVLKPSVADYNGTIALVSTTSSLTNSLYYDITNGIQKGWEVFKWTAYDNPHMAKQWDKEIQELKASIPNVEQTPFFRRMYLNEWVVDEAGLIYKYKPENLTTSLPDDSYRYVMGIDLGYNDATSFVIVAYSSTNPILYVIHSYAQSGLIVTEVAEKIKEYIEKYNPETIVIDGASKQVVEELKKRHSLPLIVAEKQDKRGHIELLNSDLIIGNIKILPEADSLIKEWSALVWDERELAKGKFVEHPKCPNHISDAFLYAWRFTYNYTSKPNILNTMTKSEQQVEDFWEKESNKETTEWGTYD